MPLLFTSLTGGTGPVPSPHRYWRIYITDNNDTGSLTSLSELQMYEAASGPNVCSGGTASADSALDAFSTAVEAFDSSLRDLGSASTQDAWASDSTSGFPHWLAYDFGAGNEQQINAIGVHGRQGTSWGIAQMPNTFDIQYSDNGADWTTAWSESGHVWTGFEFKKFTNPAHTVVPFGYGFHAHWRAVFCKAEDDDATALAELVFKDADGTAIPTTGGAATASSQWDGSLGPANAFDGNAATLWSAANRSHYSWLAYQFALPVEPSTVEITARQDVAPNTSPGHIAIQFADSPTGPWTTVMVAPNETGWVLGETRSYDFIVPVID